MKLYKTYFNTNHSKPSVKSLLEHNKLSVSLLTVGNHFQSKYKGHLKKKNKMLTSDNWGTIY
jgi:hypothetical protein